MRVTVGLVASLAGAVVAAAPPCAQAQGPPPPALASPPPPPDQLAPGVPEPAPTPLPPGITAGPPHPPAAAGTPIPNTRRWVSDHFQVISRRKRFYIREWLRFSCEHKGRATESYREGRRWVKRSFYFYRCDPAKHTFASRGTQISLSHRQFKASKTVRVRITFVEGRQVTATTLTMRRSSPPPSARAAANQVWLDGNATCQRSGSGSGGGQLVVGVPPDATFGMPYGSVIEWRSWMYVYDPARPSGQRYFWVGYPDGYFSYIAATPDSGSSRIMPLAGGGGIWYSGGSIWPGTSGSQPWTIGAGQYVSPAIVIRYRDWNFVHIWDAQPPGIYYSPTWCHFF